MLIRSPPNAYKAAIQVDAKIIIVDLDGLIEDTDLINRRGRRNDHWLWLRTLYPILSW